MEEIFEKTITDEEFYAVIAIACTNTAPSPTGLTFNMIKKWPEDVKKTIFKKGQSRSGAEPNNMVSIL